MYITVIRLTDEEASLARFQSQRGSLRFLEGARHRLAEDGLAAILPSWRDKAAGDRTVLVVPPGLLFLREVDLPLADRDKARALLPLELKGETALESDDLVFELVPLANGRWLAAWCATARLAEQVARLAAHGLDPEFVTSAMFTWHRILPAGVGHPVALTDGAGLSVYRAGSAVFHRALPAPFRRNLESSLAACELSREIEAPVLFGVGALPDDPDMAGLDLLPVDGELATAFGADPVAARDLAPLYAAAAATLDRDPVNLRRGPLAYTRRRDELRRRLRLTGILAALLVLLAFGEAGLRLALVSRDIASLDRSILTIYREAFPKRTKPVDEVAELKAELKRLGAASPDGVLTPLRKLAEAKGEELGELYEVEIDGSLATGKGSARTPQGVTDFKNRATPLFGALEVSEIKSRPDGSTGFVFRSTLKEGSR
jgi:general secretion pathway protein L